MSEIQAVIKMLEENPMPADDLEAAAKQFDEMAPRAAADIDLDTVVVEGIPCLRYTPPGADTSRIIMFLHGGGYVFGSLRSHEGLVGEIARAGGCSAIAVDYRLAPAHPYPAAVEDSVKVYEWLLANDYAANKISIAGDSAGGGLTIATLVQLKEAGAPLPGAAVCMSPWTDLACAGDSYQSRADKDPILNEEMLRQLGEVYAAGNLSAPTASPIHADLSGLPPLLIQVGEAEVLFSDAETLHHNAQSAGVDSTFEEWDAMIHVWHAFYPMLADGRRAISRIGEFVRAQAG